MAVTLAFANQKGGVGKTVSALNIGTFAAKMGLNTLLIDGDPQCNLSTALLGLEATYNRPVQAGIAGIYMAAVSPEPLEIPLKDVSEQIREHLTIIPAHMELGGSVLPLQVVQSFDSGRIMMDWLEKEARKQFDLIVIDCSPDSGIFTMNALAAADWLIVPVQAEEYALQGYSYILRTLSMVKRRNCPVQLMGAIITMVDDRGKSQREWKERIKTELEKQNLYLGMVHRSSLINTLSDSKELLCDRTSADRIYKEYQEITKTILTKAGLMANE